ncbi:MAG: AI-2E family transporter [Paraclostridium sp.]
MNDKRFYINLIISIVISYLIIKFIDNYRFLFGVISTFVSLLTPFIIGFILAYVLNPIVSFIQKLFKIKRLFSLFITYGIILLLIGSFLFVTGPILLDNLIDLVNQLPIYVNQTQDFLTNLSSDLKNIDPEVLKKIGNEIVVAIPEISNILFGSIKQIFSTTFSITKFIIQFVLAFIICFYILLDKENLLLFIKNVCIIIFGKNLGCKIINLFSTLNINIGKYFTGKILDSAIVGLISTIGLYFIGSRYALLFGILMGFTNMIPYFGPVIGMTPVVIINLFYNPSISLFSLIFLILVQQVEVIFIEPKIVGGQLGLSPLLTLLAVTIGGGFFGIPGMILSAPIMGVIKIYFTTFFENNKHKLG